MSSSRLNLYPIKLREAFEKYQKALKSIWVPSEVGKKIQIDIQQFKNLDPDEQFMIKRVLGLFATSDGIVNKNLSLNFSKEFDMLEVQMWYALQEMIENVHVEVYSNLLRDYIPDPIERENIQNLYLTDDYIKSKAEWCMKYIGEDTINVEKETKSDLIKMYEDLGEKGKKKYKNIYQKLIKKKKNLTQRVFAFMIIEGLFFTSSFCIIFWYNEKNMLPTLCTANEFISRDEGMHTDFAIHLLNNKKTYNLEPLSEEKAHKIMLEAVERESQYVKSIMKKDFGKLTSLNVIKYVQYTADVLLQDVGYKPLYNVSNPFGFMKKQNIGIRMSDFLKTDVTEYSFSETIGGEELEDLSDVV